MIEFLAGQFKNRSSAIRRVTKRSSPDEGGEVVEMNEQETWASRGTLDEVETNLL